MPFLPIRYAVSPHQICRFSLPETVFLRKMYVIYFFTFPCKKIT